jgi:aryl carrier-like protein
MGVNPYRSNLVRPDEDIMRELFAEVLMLEEVDPDESFFKLSGDSINVMRLVNRARRSGLNITIQDVFEAKTVHGLAAVSRKARERGRETTKTPPTESMGLASLSRAELEEIDSELEGDR